MARGSVPIPRSPPPEPRGGVVRSSLDLVFSYSRSQQRFFHGLPSAPSFVDYQWGDGEGEGDGHSDSNATHSDDAEWDAEGSATGSGHTSDAEGVDDESAADSSAFFDSDPAQASSSSHAEQREEPLETVAETDEVSPSPSTKGQPVEAGASAPVPTGKAPEAGNGAGRGAAASLPAKRGGIISLFSSTPRGDLSSSMASVSSSSGSQEQTPRATPRRLPEDPSPRWKSYATAAKEGTPAAGSYGATGAGSGTSGTSVRHAEAPSTEVSPLLARRRASRASARSGRSSWRPERLTPNDDRNAADRHPSPRARRKSRKSIVHVGESSDGQTLFNTCAVLVGIGLLSMPLAFSFAGWICGTIMTIGFSYLTCHTAKLLARLIFADPSLSGYTDIGRAAFGPRAGLLINVLFCFELFGLGIALIVLFGDSVNVLFPQHSPEAYMCLGFFIIVPTTFMRLNLLAIPSLLSTIATAALVGIILYDGFWKTVKPGSILDPMPTRLGPEMQGMNWLGGIGLVLAGFGGHAVVPSIAKDMRNPKSCDRVFNISFSIAAAISMISGAAGYLMCGDGVSDEITREMMDPKFGYPVLINLVAVWMIVINPLTKFGLCTRPLSIAIEGFLNLAPAPPAHMLPRSRAPSHSGHTHRTSTSFRTSTSAPLASAFSTTLASTINDTLSHAGVSDYLATGSSFESAKSPASPLPPLPVGADPEHDAKEAAKGVMRIVCRSILTAACTAAAIFLPGFGRVMAFMGSFSAFLICIILPLGFFIRLAPRILKEEDCWQLRVRRVAHVITLIGGIILMCLGTAWTVFTDADRDG